jgi:integrase
MPKSHTPGLQKEKRGDTVYYYYRNKETGERSPRIEAEYGTPAFMAAYKALHAAATAGAAPMAPALDESRTLRWLINEYRESTHWLGLSASTRRQRNRVYNHAIATSPDVYYAEITSQDIDRGVAKRLKLEDGPSRRAKTDGIVAANFFLTCMNALFGWATDQVPPLLDKSPSAKVKSLKKKRTGGFRKWTEAEMEQYRQFWPVGTRERLVFDVFHYTGMRCSDAIHFKPADVRPDGAIEFTTVKTVEKAFGFMSPELAGSINAFNMRSDDAFLLTRTGEPFKTAISLGNCFVRYCRKAGLPAGLSAHGVRKAAATIAAEAGATPYELMGAFGWKDLRTPLIYTNEFSRKQGGLRAAQLIAEKSRQVVVAFPTKKKA